MIEWTGRRGRRGFEETQKEEKPRSSHFGFAASSQLHLEATDGVRIQERNKRERLAEEKDASSGWGAFFPSGVTVLEVADALNSSEIDEDIG